MDKQHFKGSAFQLQHSGILSRMDILFQIIYRKKQLYFFFFSLQKLDSPLSVKIHFTSLYLYHEPAKVPLHLFDFSGFKGQ